jgi:hypothetical protein
MTDRFPYVPLLGELVTPSFPRGVNYESYPVRSSHASPTASPILNVKEMGRKDMDKCRYAKRRQADLFIHK